MAEKSMFWATGSIGDGATSYTQEEWFAYNRRMYMLDFTAMAVLPSITTGMLAVSVPGADQIAVASGDAVVYGIPYTNSASVTKTMTRPVVNTTGWRAVLQADWAAQTVRIVCNRNTDGVAAIPALTQTALTTWELPLAGGTITTGGVVTISSDYRTFLRYPQALIGMRYGGSSTNWQTAGTTNYRSDVCYISAGCVNWSGVAATSGSVVVTHVSYNQRPLYIVNVINQANAKINASAAYASGTTFTLYWESVDGATTFTSIDFAWMIYGQRLDI